MVVGNVPEAADLVVAGAGPGGYEAALLAAAAGRKVTLVDPLGEAGIGGVCLDVGCIPSKMLIEAADLHHRARTGERFGLSASGLAPFSLARFQTWRQETVTGLRAGVVSRLRSAGVEICPGTVTLTEPRVVVIDAPGDRARFLQFNSLVLATGSRPTPLPGLAFDGERVLDSTGVLALTELPASLAVVGGGYIGLELGIAFAKLGSAVTLIEAEDRLLPNMDPGLARPVGQRLRELGVDTLTGSPVEGLGEHGLRVGGEATREIDAEKILVAIGRTPNTDRLGLEVVSPALDHGLLRVGPDRRISERIAALGDITPGPALAHKASAEAAVAVEALGGGRAAFEPAAIPAIVFSDPEIACAGLGLEEARAAGIPARAARVPLAASGRAATLGQRHGFTQVVYAEHGGDVLGVQIASPHASELVAEVVLAIEMGARVEDLALTIHPHPTFSEQLMAAARRTGPGKG